MDYASITYIDVVIANGAQTSGEADLSSGRTLVGIIMPAALTSTALTFTSSDHAGGTHNPVYAPDGSALSVTVAAARHIPLNPTDWASVRYLKVVGGSSEGGARTIRLVVRRV